MELQYQIQSNRSLVTKFEGILLEIIQKRVYITGEKALITAGHQNKNNIHFSRSQKEQRKKKETTRLFIEIMTKITSQQIRDINKQMCDAQRNSV